MLPPNNKIIVCDNIYYISTLVNKERKGKLYIDNSQCQSCGVCVKNCPTDALSILNDNIKFNEENCIYCRHCECLCPVNAIKIDFEDEINSSKELSNESDNLI